MRQREDPVRLLARRILLIALCICAIFGLIAVWDIYQKERESAELAHDADVQAADISERQSELQKDIAELQTDRGKEEALRSQYALAAQGEGVIIIVDQASQTTPTASSSAFVDWLHKTFPWW